MSKDTIFRQDAIEAFWSLDVELRPSAIDAILKMLNGLPTAEPRYGGNYKCYKCGAEIHPFELMGEWRYCPNCGEVTVWVGVDAEEDIKGWGLGLDDGIQETEP